MPERSPRARSSLCHTGAAVRWLVVFGVSQQPTLLGAKWVGSFVNNETEKTVAAVVYLVIQLLRLFGSGVSVASDSAASIGQFRAEVVYRCGKTCLLD